MLVKNSTALPAGLADSPLCEVGTFLSNRCASSISIMCCNFSLGPNDSRYSYKKTSNIPIKKAFSASSETILSSMTVGRPNRISGGIERRVFNIWPLPPMSKEPIRAFKAA